MEMQSFFVLGYGTLHLYADARVGTIKAEKMEHGHLARDEVKIQEMHM